VSKFELVREAWAKEWSKFIYSRTGQKKEFPASARWDSGEASDGKKYKINVWKAAAAICEEGNYDIKKFVRAQFFKAREVPFPNSLLSNKAIKHYTDLVSSSFDEIANALTAQLNQFSNCTFRLSGLMDENEAKAFALMDRTVGLSALFRYCVAYWLYKTTKEAQFDNILSYWREEAVNQYLDNAALYIEIWDDLLPNDLVRENE
jgi:hypothetical protein